MANTPQVYCTGILNWYHDQISSGRLEEINNSTGAIRRMAYGHRDNKYCVAKHGALNIAEF